jgi:hypothetical protein
MDDQQASISTERAFGQLVPEWQVPIVEQRSDVAQLSFREVRWPSRSKMASFQISTCELISFKSLHGIFKPSSVFTLLQ